MTATTGTPDPDDHDEHAFEAFVALMLSGCRRHDELDGIVREGDFLRTGEMSFNLRSVYESYRRHEPETREDYLRQLIQVQVSVASGVDSVRNATLAEARERLRPKLWNRAMFTQATLQAIIDDGHASALDTPTRQVGQHLLLSIAYDTPDSIQTIPRDVFDGWGISFDEAMEIAVENLAETTGAFVSMSAAAPEEGSSDDSDDSDDLGDSDSRAGDTPAIVGAMTGDNYDSSRFLIDRPFEVGEIGYPRWAFAPARDSLTVTGADSDVATGLAVEMAMNGLDDPKPLPPFPLVDTGQGWTVWTPPAGSAAAAALALAQHDYLMSIYAEQRIALHRTAATRRDFAYVAPMTADAADGPNATDGDGCDSSAASVRPITTTRWTLGTETLLPEADRVTIETLEGQPLATFEWADLMERHGEHLAQAEGLYPTLWRTLGQPDAASLLPTATAAQNTAANERADEE